MGNIHGVVESKTIFVEEVRPSDFRGRLAGGHLGNVAYQHFIPLPSHGSCVSPARQHDGCRVAYTPMPKVSPLERCPCGGPMRTFKDGGKACGSRRPEGEPAAPAPRPCPTCGQPMSSPAPAGASGSSCSACGITEAGRGPSCFE